MPCISHDALGLTMIKDPCSLEGISWTLLKRIKEELITTLDEMSAALILEAVKSNRTVLGHGHPSAELG